MKLYWHPISMHSQRPAILAAELGISLEKVLVDPSKGENRTPHYLALNPMGKIPTLVDDDGWTLWESTAIMTYLASKHDSLDVWPNEARARADVMRWMLWSTAHFDPAVGTLMWENLLVPKQGGTPNQTAIEKATKDLSRYAPILNAQLEGKEWVTGKTYTLADIQIGSFARTLLVPQLGFNWAEYPHLKSWMARLDARPAWKAVFGAP
jgi:glutathione S-transferase